MKPNVLALAGIAASFALGAEAQSLGTADQYAVLAGTAVTNTGATVLTGDLGLYPGTAASVTGFGSGMGSVSGATNIGNAAAMQAQSDAASAFSAFAALTPTAVIATGNLGGLALMPGVYSIPGAAQLTGTLTLDGPGVYVFQVGTLTTAISSSLTLTGGATASDVYFVIGSSATLGAGTSFAGSIIASTSDTLNLGANVSGSVIALNGPVTLNDNLITAVPEPPLTALLMSGTAFLVAFVKRGRGWLRRYASTRPRLSRA